MHPNFKFNILKLINSNKAKYKIKVLIFNSILIGEDCSYVHKK